MHLLKAMFKCESTFCPSFLVPPATVVVVRPHHLLVLSINLYEASAAFGLRLAGWVGERTQGRLAPSSLWQQVRAQKEREREPFSISVRKAKGARAATALFLAREWSTISLLYVLDIDNYTWVVVVY